MAIFVIILPLFNPIVFYFLLIIWHRYLPSHKTRDSAVGFFNHSNFFTSYLFCTRPGLARGRARQACPILVYSDRISGSAASRYIVHERREIEDWPNPVRIVANIAEAHVTGARHIERSVRIVRITGNSPVC